MKYYIFRHGETYYTKKEISYGVNVVNAQIIESGIPTIEKLARHIKDVDFDYCVSSEFKRVVETTQIVTRIIGNKFVTDRRLNELMEPQEPKDTYPYTENFDQMVARVRDFLDDVRAGNYEKVLICTHGAIIAALKHLIVEGAFDKKSLYDYPKPGVLVTIENSHIEEIDFN